VGIRKQIEFEQGERSYRIVTSLDNTYDIHGFNSLMQKVSIHTDLNTGEKVFVNWSNVGVLRFVDAPDDAPVD
jgi:hypothetical protein